MIPFYCKKIGRDFFFYTSSNKKTFKSKDCVRKQLLYEKKEVI